MSLTTINQTRSSSNSWEIFVQLEPAIELSLCVPCLLTNVYFALRFSKISTFNANLKIVMVRALKRFVVSCLDLCEHHDRFHSLITSDFDIHS